MAEWVAKYLDYKGLKGQINCVRDKALALAKSYDNISGKFTRLPNQRSNLYKEITGESITATIDISKLKDEQKFWEMMRENVNTVNEFYAIQSAEMVNQFHSLVRICVSMVSSRTHF